MNITNRNFAAVYCVYDDPLWLSYSLESVYDCCDVVLVLVGERPWHGEPADNSRTLECVTRFPDRLKKIELVRGSWRDEVEQRNFGMAVLQNAGFKYCFIVDADEIYDPRQLRSMMNYAADREEVGCWTMRWYTYWKSLRYRIDPLEPWAPPVFLKVGKGIFTKARNVAASKFDEIPVTVGLCHHMSYARPDADIRRKISTFSHATEIMGDWYERVWKGWDSDRNMLGLHPINPAEYVHACPYDYSTLPPVLRALFERNPDYPQGI